MKKKARILVASATACALTGALAATPLPKEGNYDYTACWSGTSSEIAFAKDKTGMSYDFTGTTMSNPPGGLFDKNTFHCVGLNTSINGKFGGGNICESVDPDGDKRLTRFFVGPDGTVTRDFVAGTGKYEGMVVTTKITPVGGFPVVKAGTFQDCNRQVGTYKLK